MYSFSKPLRTFFQMLVQKRYIRVIVSSSSTIISKTSFLKFEQCAKAFYLYKQFPYLRDKLSTDKQLTFKRGHQIGLLAQQLFPRGTDISLITKTNAEAIEETKKRLAAGEKVLYEAAFAFNGTLVLLDLLVLTDEGYDAYEVKSSVRVSETYIKDACLQYYVVSEALPRLNEFYLVTLNADYRLQGTLDLKQLFKRRSIKQRAFENKAYFEHRIQSALKTIDEGKVPQVETGKHCLRPYQCDFFGHCWKQDLSSDSVFDFPMVGKDKLWEWYEAGIKTSAQLSAELMPRPALEKVLQSINGKQTIVEKDAISTFLNMLGSSCIAMDMEAYSPPVPQLEGTGPFYQFPFLASFYNNDRQFSIFIDSVSYQGMQSFAEDLIAACEAYAHILVYDKNLERIILQNLSSIFPPLTERLKELEAKLVDISDVFKNLHFYHPDFKGSFSLKTLMAVLLPQFSYKGIISGLAAMDEYEQYIHETNTIEREFLKTRLIDYCEMDAKACFLLKGFLEQQVKE